MVSIAKHMSLRIKGMICLLQSWKGYSWNLDHNRLPQQPKEIYFGWSFRGGDQLYMCAIPDIESFAQGSYGIPKFVVLLNFTALSKKFKCQHFRCFILAFSCRTKDHMLVSNIGAFPEHLQPWIVQKSQCLHWWPSIWVRLCRGRIRNMTITGTGRIKIA